MNRRNFIEQTSKASLALSILGLSSCKIAANNTSITNNNELFFKISLAQWSFHRALRGNKMDHLDFAAKSRSFGCEGLEYVNGFFKDKATDFTYLKEMQLRANSEGQKNVLIMIDGEGNLANPSKTERLKTIENHYKWVDAAHFLGCHAIRVNLAGGIDKADALKASIESLETLSNYAKKSNVNILVENHGGFSSDGTWMKNIFSQIKSKNCGTLPDFGNFCIEKGANKECIEAYDRYQGIQELLPYAKAVSAKSYQFDAEGNETTIDYFKVLKMVKDINYNGFIGIEFEGSDVSEERGVELTRDLLIKAGKQLS